jgi:hypothetical protein
MNMTGAFCGAAGMTLAGWWLDLGQYQVMFTVFASSYALAALCWFVVDVTKPLTPSLAEKPIAKHDPALASADVIGDKDSW